MLSSTTACCRGVLAVCYRPLLAKQSHPRSRAPGLLQLASSFSVWYFASVACSSFPTQRSVCGRPTDHWPRSVRRVVLLTEHWTCSPWVGEGAATAAGYKFRLQGPTSPATKLSLLESEVWRSR